MAIYTLTGRLKFDQDLKEILNDRESLTYTQFDRSTSKSKFKFQGCDFRNLDLRGLHVKSLVMDECDFSGSDLRGCVFENCGFRSTIFNRCQLDGADFIGCNLREGYVTECWAFEAKFLNCNMHNTSLERTTFVRAHFENNDMRKVNARNCDFTNMFWEKNRARGMILRNTQFNWSNAPEFFHNEAMIYPQVDPSTKFYAFKLTDAHCKGIYHPLITYSVGKECVATEQDTGHVPLDARDNIGIALAPMDWCLREWVLCGAHSDYHLFLCEFNAEDVIINEGNAKFNVKRMKIIKEIDMTPYVEMMSEDVNGTRHERFN